MLCDTHCHLDFDWFDTDRMEVLDRAIKAGIVRILNPGVDLESSRKAVMLAEENEQIFAAVGLHPNDGSSWNENSLTELRQLAGKLKVRAIGEIGLDYYRQHTEPVVQKRIFNAQLELAADLDMPVVIHIRDRENGDDSASNDALMMLEAHVQVLRKLEKAAAENPGVLHAFSGDLSKAERAIRLGFCIGVGGPVTYKNAGRLRKVVEKIPLDSIVIETDSPFLSPMPQRGRRNEPANVRLVAEQIGLLRSIDSGDINKITTSNAERLFRW